MMMYGQIALDSRARDILDIEQATKRQSLVGGVDDAGQSAAGYDGRAGSVGDDSLEVGGQVVVELGIDDPDEGSVEVCAKTMDASIASTAMAAKEFLQIMSSSLEILEKIMERMACSISSNYIQVIF